MEVTVLGSLQGDSMYSHNFDLLTRGINNEEIRFMDTFDAYKHDEEFEVTTRRLYDFCRTAKARVREAMTNHLINIPGILGIAGGASNIRIEFEKLFNYQDYSNGTRVESFKMLIFKHEEYVVHVYFNCNTMRVGNQYTVATITTCQKYEWFPCEDPQDPNVDGLVGEIGDLRLDDSDDDDSDDDHVDDQ